MRLRIVTYNVHKCIGGLDRRYDPVRIAATLAHHHLASHPFATLDHRAPIVLGGDFNDVWGTLGRKLLAPAGFRGTTTAAATFPAYAPIRALDAIYVRGAVRLLHVERSRFTLARQASDHLPLFAEVQLHPRAETSAPS